LYGLAVDPFSADAVARLFVVKGRADDRPLPLVAADLAQVLAQQTNLDPGLTGGDIENAFQKSGLFLEAGLAAGSAAPR